MCISADSLSRGFTSIGSAETAIQINRLFSSQRADFLKILSANSTSLILETNFHEVLLNIYPLYCSDLEFFEALYRLNKSESNQAFLIKYVLKELAKHGFPDRKEPSHDVLNVVTKLSEGLANFNVQVREEEAIQSKPKINWKKYTNNDIADAWLARDIALFHNVIPAEISLEHATAFEKIERSNDRMIEWLCEQVKLEKDTKKIVLVKRIIEIGNLFAQRRNFHGVVTIGFALRFSPFKELIAGHKFSKKTYGKYLSIMNISNYQDAYHEYHNQLKRLDTVEARLPILHLYKEKFIRLVEKLNAQSRFEMDTANAIGRLIKSIEFDQAHSDYKLSNKILIMDSTVHAEKLSYNLRDKAEEAGGEVIEFSP